MFDQAESKQKKLQEERRKAAAKKLALQRAEEARKQEIQDHYREREEDAAREKAEAEKMKEAYLLETGGIFWERKRLKVIPDARIDDKLILPPSAFEDLEAQRALDRVSSGVLTFEVRVSTGNHDGDIEMGPSISMDANAGTSTAAASSDCPPPLPNLKKTKSDRSDEHSEDEEDLLKRQQYARVAPNARRRVTCCGVAEFSGEEGTVRFGPKVLFSLTNSYRFEGSSSSDSSNSQNLTPQDVEFVDVRFIQLNKHRRCRCIFQPKGSGFFEGTKESEMQTINLDIRRILEKQLTQHTCLSQGDVIPIRDPKFDANRTFYLTARVLEPEASILLVNTEMEIEVLPSEQVEMDQESAKKALERLKKREERRERERERREKWKEMDEKSNNSSSSSGQRGVEILVRLPSGNSVTRLFRNAGEAKISDIFKWLCNIPETMLYTYYDDEKIYDSDTQQLTLSQSAIESNCINDFELVQSWPGHVKNFSHRNDGKNSLLSGGLDGRREQLFFKQINDHAEADAGLAGDSAISNQDQGKDGDGDEDLVRNTTNKLELPSGEWAAVGAEAFQKIDDLIEEKDVDSATIFQVMQNYNVKETKEDSEPTDRFHYPPPKVAQWAKRYGKTLSHFQQYYDLGPDLWLSTVIPLLEKHNGSMKKTLADLGVSVREEDD